MKGNPRLRRNTDLPQVALPPLPGPDYPPTGLASAVAVRVAAVGREIEVLPTDQVVATDYPVTGA